ncbi:hypothetical protein [Saccharopolyspora pogona]|uniref:hypothetical protein n=1 Tax=Saccharopolyspora pogona TaxID=333966 RepID=UPI0016882A13|nr:hypothetical protein [Saccharopolyspora pogona]
MERKQQKLTDERPQHVERVRGLLARDRVAVVDAEHVVPPPPTPAGRARPATAIRVRAVQACDGEQLVDVTARIAGPRAKFVPAAAIERDQAVEQVHQALLHRPLITWSESSLDALRELAGHPDLAHCWARSRYSPPARAHRNHAAELVGTLATSWRGQLDLNWNLVPCLTPGDPGRLLLLLQRIAGDTVTTHDHDDPDRVADNITTAAEPGLATIPPPGLHPPRSTDDDDTPERCAAVGSALDDPAREGQALGGRPVRPRARRDRPRRAR